MIDKPAYLETFYLTPEKYKEQINALIDDLKGDIPKLSLEVIKFFLEQRLSRYNYIYEERCDLSDKNEKLKDKIKKINKIKNKYYLKIKNHDIRS